MPALDIDRDAAHEAAQRELAKPIYPKASLTERFSEWLQDLLFRIAQEGSQLPGGWFTISVLLIILAVAIFVEECRAHDLTPVQYASLVSIRNHPGIDATRLSAVIAFDRSTLGSVIERLEAKAYVERRPSPGDKRTKLLYLTKAGAALLRDILPSVERAQARMLQPLKPADRKTLLALLTQLVDLNNEASRVPLRAEDALEHLGKSG